MIALMTTHPRPLDALPSSVDERARNDWGDLVQSLSLVQVGVGLIGGTTIEQVLANRATWRDRFGIDVRYVALIVGDGAIVAEDASGIPDEALQSFLALRKDRVPLAVAAAQLGLPVCEPIAGLGDALAMGQAVVMDTATGSATGGLTQLALERGAGMVFSNKSPLALPGGDPIGDALWAAAGPNGHVRYETTCGAGLPIISTLRSLLDTGDQVIEIVGTVSGTLGAIFSDLAAGKPFSQAVRSAKELGYTEPDPRDDLSGLDVARKALILARTIGRAVDLDELAIENLVPPELMDVSVAEFLERCGEVDQSFADRAAAAKADGKTLKYVCRVTPEEPISVGVQPIATTTVLGALQGPENIVSIRTVRYDAYPLTITGPGAGAAVTAAGVVADMLALATGPIGGPR